MNGMFGIVTPEGLDAWRRGRQMLVRDFSTGVLEAHSSAAACPNTLHLFGYAKDGSDLVADAAATGATAQTMPAATYVDTNLSSKNRSPNAPCTYTRFGISLVSGRATYATATSDTELTDAAVLHLTDRAWVKVMLGTKDAAFDEGLAGDFLINKFPQSSTWTTNALASGGADYPVPRFHNTETGGTARLLPMPFPVEGDTHIGADILGEKQGGFVMEASIDITVIAEFQGLRPLGRR